MALPHGVAFIVAQLFPDSITHISLRLYIHSIASIVTHLFLNIISSIFLRSFLIPLTILERFIALYFLCANCRSGLWLFIAILGIGITVLSLFITC